MGLEQGVKILRRLVVARVRADEARGNVERAAHCHREMSEIAAYSRLIGQHIACRRRRRGAPDAVGDVGANPGADRLYLRIARSDLPELGTCQSEQLLHLAIAAREKIRDCLWRDGGERDSLRVPIDGRWVDVDRGKVADTEASRTDVDAQEPIDATRIVELFDRQHRLRRDGLAAHVLAEAGRYRDIEDEQGLRGDVVLQLGGDMKRFHLLLRSACISRQAAFEHESCRPNDSRPARWNALRQPGEAKTGPATPITP